MISAKLIKSLEYFGFELELPMISSRKELIRKILEENNNRLNYSFPLIIETMDTKELKELYSEIYKEKKYLKIFKKLLFLSQEIFKIENKANNLIESLDISFDDIQKPTKTIKQYFLEEYRRAKSNFMKKELENNLQIAKDAKKIDLNMNLKKIFSSGKIKILNKIINHQTLSRTEYNYYSSRIKPILNSILDENIKIYLNSIKNTKLNYEE